jgi:ribonuclease III
VTGLDWKTRLQELTAELGLGVPEYVITYVGPHAQTFTARATVNGEMFDRARAATRRKPNKPPPQQPGRCCRYGTGSDDSLSQPGRSSTSG